jgi:hypothetical protein
MGRASYSIRSSSQCALQELAGESHSACSPVPSADFRPQSLVISPLMSLMLCMLHAKGSQRVGM